MVTFNYTRTISKKSTILLRTNFEKANATGVAEHNIVTAIVLCIQKAASEANRAITNICDLNVSNQNTINFSAKFYSRLFGIISLIATHLRSTATPLFILHCLNTNTTRGWLWS